MFGVKSCTGPTAFTPGIPLNRPGAAEFGFKNLAIRPSKPDVLRNRRLQFPRRVAARFRREKREIRV